MADIADALDKTEILRARSREASARAYRANPEKYKARVAAYRAANPEKAAACIKAARAKKPDYMPNYLVGYYERNKDRLKAAIRKREKALGDALKPANREKAMRRIARKLNATPAWADPAAIAALYRQAVELTASTGVVHHVDHIVPLQSKLVCGLHTEANMRVITKAMNQRKSNRIWPDCPDHLLLRVPQDLRSQL